MIHILEKIRKYIQYPELIPLRFIPNRLLPDYIYLKGQYRQRTGQKLNLKNPITFNEKLQWLKLYNRKPEYTHMVDKYEVREYVARTIGKEYLIPLLGVWNSFDEIPFDTLPNQFVLKCTHDSGGVVICQNKRLFDIANTREIIEKCLARNYYYSCREWAYKHIKPRIIAEELMVDDSGIELKDYKVFCFQGEPKIIQVDFDRFTEHKRNLYSPLWEYQPFMIEFPTAPAVIIQRPQPLDHMLDLARKLSAGKIHVRVDFYVIKNTLYFGELTFCHGAGYEKFDPPEWNHVFGGWIQLPSL